MVRAKTGGGNRTDLLTPKPAVRGPGQPNGRSIPTGLPYGEQKQLQQQIRTIPRGRSRPQPVEPATEDMATKGTPGNDRAMAAAANWFPQVPALTGPTARPGEPMQAGMVGQPDSIFGPGQPTNIGELLSQLGAMTGSAETQALGARLQASGT